MKLSGGEYLLTWLILSLVVFITNLSAKTNVTVRARLEKNGGRNNCDKAVNIVRLMIGDNLDPAKFSSERLYMQYACTNKERSEFSFIIENLNNPIKITPIVQPVTEAEINLIPKEIDLKNEEILITSDQEIIYTLDLKVTRRCVENYYGDFCEKFCQEDEKQHSCDDQGNKICKTSYLYIPEEDKCIFDECSQKPTFCLNSGKCLNPTKNRKNIICECLVGYTGVNCEAVVTDKPSTTITISTTSTTTPKPRREEQVEKKDNGPVIPQSTKKVSETFHTPIRENSSYTILVGIFTVSMVCIILVIILAVISYTSCRRSNNSIKINPDITGPPNMNNIFQQPGSLQPVYLDGNGQFTSYDDLPYYQKVQNFIDPRNFTTIEAFNYPTDTIRSQSSAIFMNKPEYQSDNESLILNPQKPMHKSPYQGMTTSIHDDIALSELYSKYNGTPSNQDMGTYQPGKYSFMHSATIKPYDVGYQSSTLNKRHSQMNFMNYPITLPKQYSESFYDTWKTPYSEFLLKDFNKDQTTDQNEGSKEYETGEEKGKAPPPSPKPPIEFS